MDQAAFKRHKDRSGRAWGKRDEWQQVLLDAYDYVAPYRSGARQGRKSPASMAHRIFDTTAAMSLVRAAGRLQQDLLPPGEPFFALDPGPAVQALGMDKDQAAAELEDVTAQIQPAFLTGEWDQAVIEMLTDVLISTGAMMILAGDDDQPVRFVAAYIDEIALDRGPFGRVEGIFWKKKWALRSALETWPKGRFDEAVRSSATERGEEERELAQDVVWDAAAKRWRLCVYWTGGAAAEDVIWEETSRECPWITPSYWRVAGQDYGWGPVLLALPTTKSLNKAMEITLKAAAIGMSGIYTRIDDGVFNPDTARVEPGAFWTVARNGGVLGPSIQKLAPPGDLNMSNIVLQELRMQVQSAMMDQQLPPDSQTPKSAAEIVERVKRLAQDHAGAYGRLTHEIVVPVVRRVMEILEAKGVLKTKLKIDQLLVQLRVTSPLAGSFKAARAQTYLQWLQVVQAAGGPDLVHGMTPLDVGLAEVGADMGVGAHLIYPQDVRQNIQQTVQQGIAAAMAAQAQQAQQPAQLPPPNGAPQ